MVLCSCVDMSKTAWYGLQLRAVSYYALFLERFVRSPGVDIAVVIFDFFGFLSIGHLLSSFPLELLGNYNQSTHIRC